MPPAVGNAAAISAIDRLTIKESPPTIVQFAKAAVGPLVYITHPNKTGIPDTKFIDCMRGEFQPDWIVRSALL
jgi:hypothetical protein